MSLNQQEVTSFAYFDGYTIEQIAERGLTAEDLRKVAGQCGKWAYETATPSVRSAYLARAESLIALTEQTDQYDQAMEGVLAG